MEDVGRVRPEVRPEEVADRRLRQLRRSSSVSSRFVVAPREVRVRLGEAELGQPVHDLRPGERLGQEEHVRVGRLDLVRCSHSQNANGLVCGLSTRKTRTPCSIQKRTTPSSSLPQRAPVLALEVERVDVLVLLRRVLGVLDRAVGPRAEPLGCSRTHGWSGEAWNAMSSAISMPRSPAAATSASKSSSVPSSGWIGGVAALVASRSPTGSPGSPGVDSSALFGPLRNVRPMGWIGGR